MSSRPKFVEAHLRPDDSLGTYREFMTAQEARTYRHDYGTGGWIFENEIDGTSWLFPPHLTPTDIFHHQLTRGKAGRLIGSA